MDDGTPREEDADRTVFRPNPGGQRTDIRREQPQRPPFSHEPAAPIPAITADPLLAAATPLIQLLGHLSATNRPPNLSLLREQAGREISSFERTCRERSVAMELLRPSHYALCAALDDVVLHTPWGVDSIWSERPLTLTRYRELHHDGLFFEMLDQMRQDPGKYLPALELFYLCLSLGFLGRYRDDPQGFDLLRRDLSTVIEEQRATTEPSSMARPDSLLLHLGAIPTWISLLGAAAAIGSVFALVSYELNAASDTVYLAAANAPPGAMPVLVRPAQARPVPPTPPPVTISSEIARQFSDALKREVNGTIVAVLESPSAVVLRIPAGTAFPANSAHLRPTLVPLLYRIGTIARTQPASIQVLSFTDDIVIRTVRYPSNYQLSQEQAQAIRSAILQGFADGGRISAEGRAEADPIAPNTTPGGREQNRRIEIVLHPKE